MRDIVTKAANAVGLDIYGGDCIVNNNGDIQLIDLNDFPSFSSVRDEAAKKIAEFIMNSK
jgi:glutathione synthase/RimK-type ligase-like ATP-grasp enzyme